VMNESSDPRAPVAALSPPSVAVSNDLDMVTSSD
jgi:hypothetical protein